LDRIERKELKHDKFVEQVGHTVEYAAEHRTLFTQIGAVVIGILLLAAGIYYYRQYQHDHRQEALRCALRIQNGQVGPAQNDFFVFFPTIEAKDKAIEKAWKDLAAKYPGSDEADLALFYLGTFYADKGDTANAEKYLKQVADGGSKLYGSQAKLSLAQLYGATGRPADAEKLLRDLMNNPTLMVSKDQATITLATVLMKSNPAEARKLLEPLRTEPGAVGRFAINTLGQIGSAQ
jgi:predicted negative regulator of RcsB-dependent stress response